MPLCAADAPLRTILPTLTAQPVPAGATRRWSIAIVVTLAAMTLRAVIDPLFPAGVPFLTAFPAVVIVALLAGFGPALATILGCALWIAVPVLPPEIAGTDLPLQLGAFAVSGTVIALFCAQFRAPMPVAGSAEGALSTPLTRWLFMVTIGAAVIPALVFASACWWGYHKAVADGQASVRRANTVVERHAERALQTASEVGTRVLAIATASDAELRAQHDEMHRRLADIVVGLDEVGSVSIWDAAGRGIAHSRLTEPDPKLDVADRDYFKALRSGDKTFYVSELLEGKISGERLFNAVFRRTGPAGEFAGVVVVAMKPGAFHDFYRDLANDDPSLTTFSLFRADGALITRWPEAASAARLPDSSAVLSRVRNGERAGVLRVDSSFDGGRPLMVSFQQIGSTPLYATAGLSEATILAGWYRFVSLLAAVMVPTTLGLVWVSWVALRRTQRVQAVLEELHEENRRRAHAEQALLQTQKLEALAQLTGGVAHDFNNLLAVVSNSTHLLKRMALGPVAERPVAAIGRAVASGVRLTRQLLAFSRRQTLRPEVVRLQTWLPGLADLISTTLERNIELKLEADPATPRIEVDVAELELALINLALNAKDAMPEGGRLEYTARPATSAEAPPHPGGGPMVVLTVADNGVGIDEVVLGRVFEPFYTTKPAGKGTGLGLSQVHGLCAQSGGAARIRSVVGKGTTVELFFPACLKSDQEVPPARPSAPQRFSARVLLVEDNRELAEASVAVLESAGLHVEHVASADAALPLLETRGASFDVVLSDIAMPGEIDGLGLAYRLRASMPALPVILMTGFTAQVHQATAAGLRVLAKPCEPEELLSTLREVLHKRAAAGSDAPAAAAAPA